MLGAVYFGEYEGLVAGPAISAGAGSAAGVATVTGHSPVQIRTGAGAAHGIVTVGAVARTIKRAVAIAAGIVTVAGVGRPVRAGVGTAAGTATVSAVGTIGPPIGHAAGTATVVGVSQTVTTGAGHAAGVATVSTHLDGSGAASGTSTVSGVGLAVLVHAGAGSAAGTVNVAGVSSNVGFSYGTAAGSCTVQGVGFGTTPRQLAPSITDDGWGGTLSYVWTQVSGPATATILEPTEASTDVTLDPTIAGVYIFRLTVTRSLDGLVGTYLARVPVYPTARSAYASLEAPPAGIVTVTANGVPLRVLVNSARITKTLNGTNQCGCTLYGPQIGTLSEGNDIVFTRDGQRVFGGVCSILDFTITDGQMMATATLVGYAWHLGRFQITHDYVNWPMALIIYDILALCDGTITAGFIAGLPNVTISFTDTFLNDALGQLAKMVKGANWYVDDSAVLSFAIVLPTPDPLPITPYHPKMRNLDFSRSIASAINQVKVYYGLAGPPGTPGSGPVVGASSILPVGSIVRIIANQIDVNGNIDGDFEIQVSSLDGYSYMNRPGQVSGNYGTLSVNGHQVAYYFTEEHDLNPVYGYVTLGSIAITPIHDANGQLGWPLDLNGIPTGVQGSFGNIYYFTLQTAAGETPPVAAVGGITYEPDVYPPRVISDPYGLAYPSDPATAENAFEIWVLGVEDVSVSDYWWDPPPAGTKSLITGINVYRAGQGAGSAPRTGDTGGAPWFVGTIGPKGGRLVDTTARENLAPTTNMPLVDTAETKGFFLRQCRVVDGSLLNPATPTSSTPAAVFVIVNDSVAQATLAAKLGRGAGVVTTAINAGKVDQQTAWSIGQAFLQRANALLYAATVDVVDPAAQPGQTLSINFPAPIGTANMKIQSIAISGFSPGTPHFTTITAASEVFTIDDLLKQGA